MPTPAALVPLRHKTFRLLWSANVVAALGTWMQNTGAGWLMTSLSPEAISVSLVSAATILPTFLLALPAGAIADTVDRRRFMIGVQVWTLLVAVLLVVLAYTHALGAAGLIALTFAIGIGTAMYQPAWAATLPEVVSREDLVQAVALNGIGFNLARSVGPAIGGVIVVFGGAALAFLLYALSFFATLGSLVAWRRRVARRTLPPEHFLSAMRTGMRFVRHTPPMQAAIIRSMAFFLPCAAPWATLPLIVREQLGLGAASYGLMLGLMGAGGVTAGLLLPRLRGYASRGTIVLGATMVAAAGMFLLSLSRHWAPAAFGMFLFGVGWVASASTAQAAAQLAAPAWVRARALAIYQLTWNGALAAGSLLWGWVGQAGLPRSMALAAAMAVLLGLLVRRFDLNGSAEAVRAPAPLPQPEAPAPEIASELPASRGRIMEMMAYQVALPDQARFLRLMAEVQHVRGRAGAFDWHLYEDVAHPEGWLEVWCMQNWTDHLREATRMSDEDLAALASVDVFRRDDASVLRRYLAVDPRALARQRSEAAGVQHAFTPARFLDARQSLPTP